MAKESGFITKKYRQLIKIGRRAFIFVDDMGSCEARHRYALRAARAGRIPHATRGVFSLIVFVDDVSTEVAARATTPIFRHYMKNTRDECYIDA